MATPIKYALKFLSTFYPPQKPLVFSGAGSTLKIARSIHSSGKNNVLLIADRFLNEHGFLVDLLKELESLSISTTIYDGSKPNPTLNEVNAALDLAKQHQCDSVLAVGGGSVLDVAKVVAAACTNGYNAEKLVGILKVKQQPLTLFAIPTTSGSGSETTNGAVISDPISHQKQFYVDPKLIPRVVALDPTLQVTLPANITAAVGMDALTHAIEAYLSTNNFSDSDADALTAIKLLFNYLPTAVTEGHNLEARENVAQASFLAGYAFTKASLGYVHGISHQISALYNTPHGLANAVILPRVVRFNKNACEKRLADIEMMLSGDKSTDTAKLANQFIKRLDQLSDTLEIPTSLGELQLDDFSKISKSALSEARKSYAVPKVMKNKDVMTILESLVDGNRNVFI
ncbi:iron-containing alcohol dehydrogenase [Vibrio sp. THAF190c]|uniref:iron-containing alcohol dehydrogenase n=1 Tax=Vibrio sp. THAF190c TaxID=2587865 RepID=UPI0012697336|nr:iron-containing alcohol dehydrogenase [Vibrio sp. THAF190c]QFT13025.1 Alcohol dehydrogenase 2 [Vibrio sp. THAF190c]